MNSMAATPIEPSESAVKSIVVSSARSIALAVILFAPAPA
jgi:hypothetical protein